MTARVFLALCGHLTYERLAYLKKFCIFRQQRNLLHFSYMLHNLCCVFSKSRLFLSFICFSSNNTFFFFFINSALKFNPQYTKPSLSTLFIKLGSLEDPMVFFVISQLFDAVDYSNYVFWVSETIIQWFKHC